MFPFCFCGFFPSEIKTLCFFLVSLGLAPRSLLFLSETAAYLRHKPITNKSQPIQKADKHLEDAGIRSPVHFSVLTVMT